jgi:hypothetical protein
MMIYFSITAIGSINADSLDGIFVTLQYALVFITVSLLIVSIGSDQFLYAFIRGYIWSCILSSIWTLLDTAYYYTHGLVSINELFFSSYNKHPLTNRLLIHGLLPLRASGFGWDPGGIAAALVIAYILADVRFVEMRSIRLIKAVLIVSLVLTFSRNGISVLLLYLIYKAVAKLKVTVHRGTRVQLENYLLLVFFAVFFAFSLAYPSTGSGDPGTVRHIKYLSSILYYAYASLPDLLFGFGYRGTQIFFLKYVPFASMSDFFTGANSVVESTLTNLFLYGGLYGIAVNALIFLTIIFYGSKKERTVICFLLVAYIGYTFECVWTNVLIYGFLFSALRRAQENWKSPSTNVGRLAV